MPKVVRIVVLLAVLLPLAFSAPGAAQDNFFEDRQQQIEDKKQEIEEKRQEQLALQRESLFAIRELDVTNAQIEEVDQHLNQVNSWIAAAETRLRALELSRTAAEKRVADAQERAVDLELEIAEIRVQLQDQVVAIYLDLVYEPNFLLEDGDPNRNARRQFYVEELGADAQVLIDRLRRAYDDQQASVQQAEQAQAEIGQAQTEINDALAELADLLDAQQKLQEEWNRKRELLQARIAVEAQEQTDIESEISGLEQNIEEIEDEIERERERIRLEEERRKREAELARLAELERQRQEDLARLAEQERAGQFDDIEIPAPPEFFRPVVGEVVSGYGNRVHPIFGYVRFHAGVDFANHMGDPIFAAASGTVIQVKSREGYGNTIIVDHGGGWSTLYAHLSQYNVSLNQQVEIGQTIGFVGSTGWSTGPHLHFEVRYRGSPRDPAKYLDL
ncbi:MAG: peptidoglycan DD-metalloendopeptidase family protein [Acidimicrobiia bacterium]|nr:peptidoglycan DD-metalloendopeptidase family protein [Acidimicrobiia bacterium]MYB73609.1 peptidoglycan DD-metalloendopeptidase family protein [Acidimicrobiia bacterium]MYH98290.1 peptidoglycan DD-metalloendopeptidase family protein [Acidimicrobiia bacterium]